MRHLADHGRTQTGGRLKAFMRIARQKRAVWHRSETATAGQRRLVEYLRIARGRTV